VQEKKELIFAKKPPGFVRAGEPNLLVPIGAGLLALMVVAALLVAFYFGIEVEAPVLEVQGVTAFVGDDEVRINFRAQDTGSGVDSVSVAMEQAELTLPVGRFQPEGVVHDFSGSFVLSKKIPGLREGPATLHVEVRDRSLWKSTSRSTFPIVIDSLPPSLQILSAPRAMEVGGVGLFVYKAGDANLTASGLSLGEEQYVVGKPASFMDPDLLQSELFALIATAPSDIEKGWAVFASDVAGHTVKAPLVLDLRNTMTVGKKVREYASEGTLIRLLASLSQDAWSVMKEPQRRKIESLRQDLESNGRAAAIAFASYLMTSVRDRELDAIKERLNVEPPAPRRWQGEMFSGSFTLRIGFGDTVVMGDDEGDLVSWTSQGEVLEPIGDTKSVVAPYAGTVRMAGRLGTLGEIVVVDHGVGLASVFYSLDQRQVFEGAVVSQGQVLADVGASGLHTTRRARMLLLVNGRPVDPAPWRQPSGIGSAVEGALNGIKGALGIESSSAEERP
jgi:murein DD-endopeptidase MepM/ murein hydrolase activator NlpD